ncbi:MAG TPA: hypothetical protein VGE97_00220 [Nitrososphaera sp.]
MSSTHIGQRPGNHVILDVIRVANTGDTKQDLDFLRINQDGTKAGGPPWFRVPSQQVLVVTDVDWQYNLGTAGQIQTFRIFIENLADPKISNRVFESVIILNSEGQGGISESMTSGFVVSSAGRIVVDTFPGGGVISHVIIRGYLMTE